MIPDICTKPICNKPELCHNCRHALYKGHGIDEAGKLWMWEYRPRFGVDFVRKDGKHLKCQPIIGDPVWELFEEWKMSNKIQNSTCGR